ncbi:rhodanese-like domain-containing protein [Geovibrio thiophilus]|uniref:Rhodanese-like domain-containing protein n=1 Tax=Geovibrio thiophilus TaxID=139438 RepID=A0A3R5XZ76_9BACT|nr:rhodanese-like domain-containing protein [Geovibrio thiophilus]QAR34321.1 rhodanese-like domain-containing protein [Geovibrio thiophilus]
MLQSLLIGLGGALLLVIFSLIYSSMTRREDIETGAIDFDDLMHMLKTKQNLRLIDLSDSAHFRMHHLKGAENIPPRAFRNLAGELLDERRTVLYCKSGRECRLAYQFLKEKGYKTDNLYYLDAQMIYTSVYKPKEAI